MFGGVILTLWRLSQEEKQGTVYGRKSTTRFTVEYGLNTAVHYDLITVHRSPSYSS